MRCDHCGSGDSHYDYNEILEIERKNLELIKQIEEMRNEIDVLKGKKKEKRKVRGPVKILLIVLAVLFVSIVGGVIGFVYTNNFGLIIVSVFNLSFILVFGFFLFLQFDDGFYEKESK